jgi:hypothetical protein
MVETDCFQTGHNTINNEYLSEMTDEQTLTMYSGHPMGLFPSHKRSTKGSCYKRNGNLIILNRMIGKRYCRRITIRTNDSRLLYVHRTTKNCTWHITVLNAFRKINRSPSGGLFLTSGLGGIGVEPNQSRKYCWLHYGLCWGQCKDYTHSSQPRLDQRSYRRYWWIVKSSIG